MVFYIIIAVLFAMDDAGVYNISDSTTAQYDMYVI